MDATPFPDRISISGQLGPEDFRTLADDGVRLVINNRPDGEAPGQLSAAEGERLAGEAGMAYRHIPVRFPTLSMADVEAFGDAVDGEPGRVHAHCAGGPRSVMLWALSRVMRGVATREQAAAWAASQGVDLSPGLAWLDRQA